MKRLFLTVLLLASVLSLHAQSWFNVGSYNVRYDSSSDKARGDGWDSRSQKIFDLVNYERWEIFGAQELLHNQLEDLLNGLDNYDYIGVGRNDGDKKGEYAPIFYRKDRIRCLDKAGSGSQRLLTLWLQKAGMQTSAAYAHGESSRTRAQSGNSGFSMFTLTTEELWHVEKAAN